LADLGHILKASNVGAQIEKNKTPLSDPALKIVKDSEKYWTTILTGGDDYELIFTSPKQMVDEISVMEKEFGVRITKIGTIIEEKTLQLFDVNGQAEQIIGIGYNHFDNQKT
jgi:thiamine-monophosphate kinase